MGFEKCNHKAPEAPAPSPKGGYAIGFGRSETDWRNIGLAADLYAEAKAIKANGGNIDTPRYSVRRENAGKSIHDLSPWEELLYMTGLYFTGGKIGLAILYGTAAQEVEKLFDDDNVRKFTDLSQFYSQSPAPSPSPRQRMIYVVVPGDDMSKGFGTTTSKKTAIKAATEMNGIVWAMPLRIFEDAGMWDYPTFVQQAEKVFDAREEAPAPSPLPKCSGGNCQDG